MCVCTVQISWLCKGVLCSYYVPVQDHFVQGERKKKATWLASNAHVCSTSHLSPCSLCSNVIALHWPFCYHDRNCVENSRWALPLTECRWNGRTTWAFSKDVFSNWETNSSELMRKKWVEVVSGKLLSQSPQLSGSETFLRSVTWFDVVGSQTAVDIVRVVDCCFTGLAKMC